MYVCILCALQGLNLLPTDGQECGRLALNALTWTAAGRPLQTTENIQTGGLLQPLGRTKAHLNMPVGDPAPANGDAAPLWRHVSA